jgi:hypothetical protein
MLLCARAATLTQPEDMSMNDLNQPPRRRFLKRGAAALAAIPVIGFSGGTLAAQNAAVRKALGYQTSPKDGKSCVNCLQFLPAKKGCTLYPDDTEIVPTGYCSGYVVKPKA